MSEKYRAIRSKTNDQRVVYWGNGRWRLQGHDHKLGGWYCRGPACDKTEALRAMGETVPEASHEEV